MFTTGAKAAIAAVCGAAAISFASAGLAQADEPAKVGSAREALKSVPVFYVADSEGAVTNAPVGDQSEVGQPYYLARAQASLAVGMVRAERASAGDPDNDLHVAVTDLGSAAAASGAHSFIRQDVDIEAANSIQGIPLFLVRDKEGAPFTLRDADGHRRVFFYLSEDDAEDFVVRVLNETHRKPSDVQLSLVGLDSVLHSILTSNDPLVQNWAIWSSAESRLDAANLKGGAEPQLASKAKSDETAAAPSAQ